MAALRKCYFSQGQMKRANRGCDALSTNTTFSQQKFWRFISSLVALGGGLGLLSGRFGRRVRLYVPVCERADTICELWSLHSGTWRLEPGLRREVP